VKVNIDGADSRIAFYCEFEPEHQVAFRYSTATGLSDLLEPINPTLTNEFDIEFKQDAEIINPVFRYNIINGLFESPVESFKPQEGSFYEVTTSLKDYPHLGTANAYTYVPFAKDFSSLEIIDLEKTGAEVGFNLKLHARFSVDVSSPYYEVEVFTREVKNGLLVQTPLQFTMENHHPGVLYMEHRSSLLIDAKKNKGQYISLVIDDSVTENAVEYAESVFFKIKTVNEDHYFFHQNMAKRIESMNAPISEPVIYYSNIEGGLGLFSGYSSRTTELSIE